MAMEASMAITDWLIEDPNGMLNPDRRTLKAIMAGIKRKENDLPSDFDESMLMDWIDEMEQDKYDEMERFIDEALGFIVATTNKRLETIFEPKKEKEVL